MRRAVLAGTVATSLLAGAAAGVILGVPVTAQSGERLGSGPKISIAAATIAAVAAAVEAGAAPAAPAASAVQADAAASAPAPAVAPAAATAHAHVMASLPARSDPGSTGAKGAESAGTEDEGSELSVIAAALHMALSDLKSGLAAGKSLAQIATSAGIDPNKLIATVVDDATSKINAAVSVGALSRAQADKIIAMLPSLVAHVVNHSFGDLGAGLGAGSKLPMSLGSLGDLASLGNFANLGKLAHLGNFANIGNMDDLPRMAKLGGIGDFKSFFSNMFGSFGNLGQAKPGANIDPQALISSIVSMATDAVNAAVSAGLLTQAQASTILAGLTPAITNLVHTILDASSSLENQAAGWASLGSSWMAQLHH
jgi:urease accessory protein UreF